MPSRWAVFNLGILKKAMSLHYVRIARKKSLCLIEGLPSTSDQETEATLIVLFDVSVSMGSYVKHFWQALKVAIKDTNYRRIEIVTFGEHAHRFTTTPRNINWWRCPGAEKSTHMYEATQIVFDILSPSPPQMFQLLIISDGELHDLENARAWGRHKNSQYVISLIKETSPTHFNKHTIQVAGIRLGQEGSTRAMTCFFKYHTHTTEPTLRDISHSPEEVQISVLELFHSFRQSLSLINDFHELRTEGSHTIRPDPMTSTSNRLRVQNGSWFISESSPRQIQAQTIYLNYIEHTSLKEEELLPFFKIMEFKIKNFKILGETQVLQGLERLLSQIEQIISHPELLDQTESDIQGKIRKIRREALKTQKSILAHIRTLLNVDNVSRLNAQQQANFLRQVGDNRNGRRLARRHGDADISTEILSVFNLDVTALSQSDSDRDEFISFLSVGTTHEILKESLEELSVVLPNGDKTMEIMSPEQLLQVIGGVGICFQGPTGDFPDPWQYRVLRVYPDIMLGQHEIWEAIESGNPDTLNAHPTIRSLRSNGVKDAAITGVDVLTHTDADKLYLNKMRNVNRIHCSISMRKVITLIPNDDIALKTAVLERQLLDVIEHPTELNIKKCWLNIESLRLMAYDNVWGSDFVEHMKSESVRDSPRFARFWTGDLDVSSILKPLAWMLVHGSSKYASTEDDMFQLELYHIMRSVINTRIKDEDNPLEERATVIKSILGLCSEHKTRSQSPGTPEPEEIIFYDNFDESNVINYTFSLLDVRAIFNNIHTLYRALRAVFHSSNLDEFMAAVKKESELPYSASAIPDSELFLVASVLQALQHAKLSDRIDEERNLKTVPLNSREECVKYIKLLVRNMYKQFYRKMLGAKKKREEEMRVELAVEMLVQSPDLEDFISILNREIPDRSSPGYVELLSELQVPEVSIRYEKLWILIFGRSLKFNPDRHDATDQSWVVWNLGNIMNQDDFKRCEHIHSKGNALGALKMSWSKFTELYRRLGYIPHVYRTSNIPNRHGHSNIHPYIPPEYRDLHSYD